MNRTPDNPRRGEGTTTEPCFSGSSPAPVSDHEAESILREIAIEMRDKIFDDPGEHDDPGEFFDDLRVLRTARSVKARRRAA